MDIHDLECTEPWEWPTNASSEILRVLRDKGASEDDRGLAATLAGDFVVINDELAGELMAVVKDPAAPVEVRARAAISFGPALEHSDCCDWSDDDDILVSEEVFNRMRQTLRKVYQDETVPKEVRRRALEGAVRAPEDWQRAAIRSTYRSGDTEWKSTAVFAMGCVDGFDKEILESLRSPVPEIQYEAVRAAGAHELADAWPHIEAILRSGGADNILLAAAIEAAPYINMEEAHGLLFHYANSEDAEISEAAVDAMHVLLGMEQEFDEESDLDDYEEYEDDEDLDEKDEEDDDSL